jgi:hypothetical protein
VVKIRLGFVSNSSSCSFCIYGKYFDDLEIEEIYNFNRKHNVELFADNPTDYMNGCYVGLEFTSIKDDETGREFKQRAQNLINDMCDKLELGRVDCEVCERGWYDG